MSRTLILGNQIKLLIDGAHEPKGSSWMGKVRKIQRFVLERIDASNRSKSRFRSLIAATFDFEKSRSRYEMRTFPYNVSGFQKSRK